jgi:hypothetical protein
MTDWGPLPEINAAGKAFIGVYLRVIRLWGTHLPRRQFDPFAASQHSLSCRQRLTANPSIPNWISNRLALWDLSRDLQVSAPWLPDTASAKKPKRHSASLLALQVGREDPNDLPLPEMVCPSNRVAVVLAVANRRIGAGLKEQAHDIRVTSCSRKV